jgi:hydrogenase maturation protease
MHQVLVIGYGNPLRGDDGLGWEVAEGLSRQNRSTALAVLPCLQLTPELASPISAAGMVLFVDASQEGAPGEFRCTEVHPGSIDFGFTHNLTPAGLLALARELFGVCPPAYLLTICGHSFAPEEVLSQPLQTSLPALKAKLQQLIEQGLALPAVR